VIALGATGSADAIALLVPLMNALSRSTDLSHYIALSIALKHLNHPKGAVHPLQKHFSEKDFHGHAVTTPVDAVTRNINQRVIATDQADGAINQVLRELVVAGMVYQCDPSHIQAKAILESYSLGVEGLYARYAKYVLKSTKK
jgi:hypothetical protein